MSDNKLVEVNLRLYDAKGELPALKNMRYPLLISEINKKLPVGYRVVTSHGVEKRYGVSLKKYVYVMKIICAIHVISDIERNAVPDKALLSIYYTKYDLRGVLDKLIHDKRRFIEIKTEIYNEARDFAIRSFDLYDGCGPDRMMDDYPTMINQTSIHLKLPYGDDYQEVFCSDNAKIGKLIIDKSFKDGKFVYPYDCEIVKNLKGVDPDSTAEDGSYYDVRLLKRNKQRRKTVKLDIFCTRITVFILPHNSLEFVKFEASYGTSLELLVDSSEYRHFTNYEIYKINESGNMTRSTWSDKPTNKERYILRNEISPNCDLNCDPDDGDIECEISDGETSD